MKRATLIMLMLVAVFAVACGGNATGNKPSNAGGHGHEHDHGKMTELARKKLGDREVTPSVNELDAGKEGAVLIKVSGDGVDKLKVIAWLEKDEKEASPKSNASWEADEKLFDCHLELRNSLAPGTYKLFIEVDGKKDSWDVEVHKD